MVKGEILKVGYVDTENVPQNWHFDINNGVPILTVTDDGFLYAGYSIDELKFISLKQ